jgi:8-oxo-dGTP pyrophosphatase MutT (NUDIX family)
MRWSPSVTVAAVIQRQDRYLMVEEAPDGTGVLNQPAGHLEFGETLVEAIRREVLEETGRIFSPQGLVGVYQWTVPRSDLSYLRFCFVGEVGEPLPAATIDSDIIATHWLTREEIVSGRFPARSPLVLRCLDDAGSGHPLDPRVLHAVP